MYELIFYHARNGQSEIEAHLDALAKEAQTSKTSRINREKILAYMKALSLYGTRLGMPFVKHIGGDLWELRPLSNRIFFFYWKDNRFVLLHHFIKKSQKTPAKEIQRAKLLFRKEQKIMSVEINGETYRTFADYMNDEHKVSSAERNRIEFEADLIGKLIEAREEKGLSQRGLAELIGMKQPQIARLESMKGSPQLDTLFKVLTPLGYTLSITPMGPEPSLS